MAISKRILVIEDFSSVGNSSLTAALPIISAFGHSPVGLPTAVLSTQTGGIKGYTFNDLSANMIPSYQHWKKLGINFDFVYVGFLGSDAAIDAVEKILKKEKSLGTPIAIDPVMADNGKLYPMFNMEYAKRISALCENYADIIMPNFTEAKILSGISLTLEPNVHNARMILDILKHNGYKSVLLSGIIGTGESGAALLSKGKITFSMTAQFDATVYGAGDILASVFLSKIMSRSSAENALRSAVAFCRDCIDVTMKAKSDMRFGLLIEKVIPNIKAY